MDRGIFCGAPCLAMGVAMALAPAARGQSTPDPVSRLALMGAAFAESPGPTPPARGVIASAFLPGRGVVRWAVGTTPQEAEEARIEAMGRADARAVQRQIDSAQAERSRAAPLGEPRWSQATAVLPRIAGGASAQVAPPLNKAARDRVAAVLGLHDGAGLKSRPRVYAFAAVSGQGLGLNLLHDSAGWSNAGLTTDRGGFTGQRQAGLAWRTGPAQTSLSYVADKSRSQILGIQSIKDHRLMLTMALTPQALAGLFTPLR